MLFIRLVMMLKLKQLHCFAFFIYFKDKEWKISKSDFRDRAVHHALCSIIEPIFEKGFIYDSYANRKGKGALKALQRFDYFKRKVSFNGEKKANAYDNNDISGYALKADIKKYFESVDHEILIKIVKKKIKDNKALWLIRKILNNCAWGGANCQRHAIGQLNFPIFC